MQEAKGWTEQDTLLFFDRHPELYPIYRVLEESIHRAYPQVRVTVQRTQITLSHRHVFACVSFLRPKRKAELPGPYFVLTLGLPAPLASGRAAAQTEPYPGRWTVHIPIRTVDELDEELFGWVGQAYAFAETKGKGCGANPAG